MKILVDTREKDRTQKAINHYTERGFQATSATLDVGDYLFTNFSETKNVVFEFKLASDFIGSITDESVFNEAMNQATKYSYNYVIIVGSIQEQLSENYNGEGEYSKRLRRLFPNPQIYYKKFNMMCAGAIRRLRTFTTVIETKTEESAFNEMVLQANKCFESKSYGGIVRPVLNTYNPVEYLLCGVHGVSDSKSQTIIDELELTTMNDLMGCTAKDFTKVRGIGSKTAEKIELWINKTTEE